MGTCWLSSINWGLLTNGRKRWSISWQISSGCWQYHIPVGEPESSILRGHMVRQFFHTFEECYHGLIESTHPTFECIHVIGWSIPFSLKIKASDWLAGHYHDEWSYNWYTPWSSSLTILELLPIYTSLYLCWCCHMLGGGEKHNLA